MEKSFRRNQIGSLLCTKAVEYLEEEKPLITIPMDKLPEFTRIAEKYNWEISDIRENLYRTTTPEVIVNGIINSQRIEETPPTFKKIYRIYKITCIKNTIKLLFNNPQNMWK